MTPRPGRTHESLSWSWGTGGQVKKAVNSQQTWRHWALPINKHSQYKQNLPDHVSHRGWSWPCNGNTRIQSDNVSNGTEKLKKQISQGFPSLVLCIVVAVAGCGPVYSYTVTPGSVDWADLWPRLLMSVISLHSLLCSCWHCTAIYLRIKPLDWDTPWEAQTGVSYLVWSNWVVSLINKLLSSFKYHWDTWGTMGTQLLNYVQTHELHAQLHSQRWPQWWQEYLNAGEPVSAFISGLSCW